MTFFARQHSFGLPLRMYGMHRTPFDHVRSDLLLLEILIMCIFDHLSRKTYANHSARAKVFWPSIIAARTL